QPQYSVPLQGRIIADIHAEKVYMIDLGKCTPGVRPETAAQIGLPDLVTATRRAATELHAACAQFHHDSLEAFGIRFSEDERKGIIAHSGAVEVGVVNLGIKIFQEEVKILVPPLDVLLEPWQLRSTDERIDLRAAHVEAGIGKNKVRVEIGILIPVFAPS